MHYVNNLLCNESVSCMFVTVFYGILNTLTGELEYVNAGHNPPYLLTGEGVKKVEMTGGTILGCIENFHYNSRKIMMNRGDRLFLYTDGVTEAFNGQNEAFGDDRLKVFLQQNPIYTIEELVKGILKEVNDHSTGNAQSDDITLLSINFNGRA
ncbi:MAG: PP2C family protein-serine/threonine phosphatase, partial [Bacteroidetes bacterium]|nr:PP2C family protein-serine/threonine phosphatase [Bacteroidota bacterium]